jgi:hypothetical protein
VIYKRTLNSSMVRALIEIARWFKRHPSEESVHAISCLMAVDCPPKVKAGLTGGVHSKLAYWDLLAEVPEVGRGHYRMTRAGWAFLRSDLRVPAALRVCGGKVLGTAGVQTVDVRDASFEKFDLDELLATRT